jgi:DNA repair exonuclease SbcCD ATPase subunit
MGESAVASKAEAEEKSGGDRTPLFWGLAIAIVVVSVAVAYRIVKTDGAIDVTGGVDGIQVKISQAQKTIASAQQEMSDAQHQLETRETELKQREQTLQERETKVQELLASLEKATPASRTLTPQQAQQAQVELKKLRMAPAAAVVTAPEPVAVKARLEKLDQLRDTLGKTSTELKAASKPVAPQ